MTSGQAVLIVLALIVCFLGFVWLMLQERGESPSADEENGFRGSISAEALNDPDDYFSKTIYKKIFK